VRKLILAIMFLFLLAPTFAIQPSVVTIESQNTNMQIVTMPFASIKQNETLYVRWWAFNGTNGVVLKNDTIYCILNLLEPQGRNVARAWIQKNFGLPSNPNACQNCFWWDITAGNFTKTGLYGLNIRCQTYDNRTLGGDLMTPLDVTESGKASTSELAIGTAITYSMLLIASIIFMIACIYFGFSLNGDDTWTMGGDLVEANPNKYLKMGLYFIAYLFAITTTFIAWQMSEAFNISIIGSAIFGTLFTILWLAFIPILLLVIIVGFMKWLSDAELHRLAERGLKPR